MSGTAAAEKAAKPNRRQQILEALAHNLETSPGERITTAGLAAAVGVSEAALYRHFPSKAKMFEGLIEFVEDAIFSRANLIAAEQTPALARCDKILRLLVGFFERNPGITRIFTGDAIIGEKDRLRARINQFYLRLELQIKTILRDAELHESRRTTVPVAAAANLLMATAQGRIIQFVQSEFSRSPSENWDDQWMLLSAGLMRDV